MSRYHLQKPSSFDLYRILLSLSLIWRYLLLCLLEVQITKLKLHYFLFTAFTKNIVINDCFIFNVAQTYDYFEISSKHENIVKLSTKQQTKIENTKLKICQFENEERVIFFSRVHVGGIKFT